MISKFVPGAAILLSLAFAAAPASASKLSGEYTITFFNGPSHTETSAQCIDFAPVGKIDDFTNSGTWTAPSFSGWGGNFVVDKSVLRAYSTYNDGADVIDFYVLMAKGTGGYDDWAVGTSLPLGVNNDGIVTLAAGCSDALKSRAQMGSDPTQRP